MASIGLETLFKNYGEKTALAGIDLDVGDGELLVVVGPSGCGKSTLLRVVAGLERPTRGRVWIDGRDVTRASPQERDLAMVFQSYALYPHKSVRENLAFGLRVRGASAEEITHRTEATAARLRLTPLLDIRPAALSGGERQRTALGRAIVRDPAAFLLDEPLSNLDPTLRVQTRGELARLQRELQATMLYVTHDQEEAMTLGKRIAVMREGRIEQIAAPLIVYRRPVNTFVAAFVGSPPMNLLSCRVRRDGSGITLVCGLFRIDIGKDRDLRDGEDVLLGIRPHDIELGEPGTADLDAAVAAAAPRGADVVLTLEARQTTLTAVGVPHGAPVPGQCVGLRLCREDLHLFRARDGRRVP